MKNILFRSTALFGLSLLLIFSNIGNIRLNRDEYFLTKRTQITYNLKILYVEDYIIMNDSIQNMYIITFNDENFYLLTPSDSENSFNTINGNLYLKNQTDTIYSLDLNGMKLTVSDTVDITSFNNPESVNINEYSISGFFTNKLVADDYSIIITDMYHNIIYIFSLFLIFFGIIINISETFYKSIKSYINDKNCKYYDIYKCLNIWHLGLLVKLSSLTSKKIVSIEKTKNYIYIVLYEVVFSVLSFININFSLLFIISAILISLIYVLFLNIKGYLPQKSIFK